MEILLLYLDATQIYSLSLSNSFIDQTGNLLQDLEQQMTLPPPPPRSLPKRAVHNSNTGVRDGSLGEIT